MRINKEGYKIIGISGAVCLLLWWLFYHLLVHDANVSLLWFSTLVLLLFWFFIVAFFREPRRVRIHDADLVFAPCDGRVFVTEVVSEDEFAGPSYTTGVFHTEPCSSVRLCGISSHF